MNGKTKGKETVMEIDYIVSALNNYIETHAYLFEDEYCGDPSDIVSNYGFGYMDEEGDERVIHWVEGGDIETCSLTLDEIRKIVAEGLNDDSIVRIMENCE